MNDLAAEIVRLQGELDREIEKRRKALGRAIYDRVVHFEQGIVAEQRRLQTNVAHFLARSPAASILTAPVILLDDIALGAALWTSFYQTICFRVYAVPRVRRADYIVFNREQLAYLNWIEAINCAYCAYGNGVVGYVREVASCIEQYWCPIKHALRITDPHQRYYTFLEIRRCGRVSRQARGVPGATSP